MSTGHRPTTLLAACLALVPALAAQDPGGWPLHGHDLGGQRYSPLSAIDTATVRRLVPAWTFRTGVAATFQATPIVLDTVMYLSLPFSGVVALDARDGRELWHYTHQPRTEKLCCGPANRGVAVAGGKVYLGTTDGRLLALDAGRQVLGRDRRRVRRHDRAPASSSRAIRCHGSRPPAPPESASARHRWCDVGSSSASPASATGCTPIRALPWSGCRGSTAAPA
jgi:hypothetical protein